MNKNDFYKQLMSEYTFDSEKIKENAKKGRFARQKISPLAIGLTASVAAVTVACGTLAITMLDNRNGISLVDNDSKTLSDLSAAERVKAAIEQQNKDKNNDEIKDVLITFAGNVSPQGAQSILFAHINENVPVKAVYLADGSIITGNEQIAAVFTGEQSISAIAVQCAASVKAELQGDIGVLLVEDWDENDISNVTPINPEDMENVDIPEATDAPESTVPEAPKPPESEIMNIPDDEHSSENTSTVGGEPVAPSTDPVDVEPSESQPAESEPNTSEPADTTDTPDATEEPAESTVPGESTTPVEPVVPEVPVVSEPSLPENVVLPLNPEKPVFTEMMSSAKSAFFLDENVLYVKSDNTIELYRYQNSKINPIASVSSSEPIIHWIAEKGGQMIISDVDENGSRNKLWLVDASYGGFIDLQASDSVMNGTLKDVGYNEEAKTLILNVKDEDEYYVCALSLTGNIVSTEYISVPFFTTAKISLVGLEGDILYLAVSDSSLVQIYSVNILNSKSDIIKTYTNNPKISHNLAFTHGIISPSASAVTGNVEIFDTVSKSFITTEYFDESLIFGASKHSFSVNGNVSTIANGKITANDNIAVAAPIDFNKSFSSTYYAYANKGNIYITDSIYNHINTSGELVFSEVEENSSADLRATLNGAIGITNTLALKACYESGIITQDMLHSSLPVYYSENAVKQLREICDIKDYGSLIYSSGGLKSINIDNVRLVTKNYDENSASGTAYIKIGSIAGKTAYRAVNINFIREGSLWKLDTIIQ